MSGSTNQYSREQKVERLKHLILNPYEDPKVVFCF